eukprot:TRINITY_DN20730_c0_g1_i1.p1 TRINITY_DN20730_c0_g1~~TRINITY_DN20730_c0_g1_i1.p1  ORF type:complete len:1139 (+),score=327.72 TRINITY_DN20730_c0_g1_i1:46-3462(+)
MRAFLLLTCVAGAAGGCIDMKGEWYDSATEDVMSVTADDATGSCVLTSKYGSATLLDEEVVPSGGLLQAIGVRGMSNAKLGVIEWSNGVLWKKTVGTDALQQRVTTLETRLEAMQTQIQSLTACTKCNVPPPVTAEPTSAPGIPPTDAPTSAPVSTPSQPTSQEFQDLRDLVANLSAKLDNTTGLAGSNGLNGYCTIEPNTTEIYIPVTRYAYRQSGSTANSCVIGGSALRGGAASASGPSMLTRDVITDMNCRWTSNMYNAPIFAYKGDTLVFWRGTDKNNNVWQFNSQQAFDECDFDKATLLAGRVDYEGLERAGKNFTITLDTAGTWFFGSSKSGVSDPDRREYCWDSKVKPTGAVSSKNKGWGRNVKLAVVVLDPTEKVMATCPLYDPSKYGVSGGQQVDSQSVERLKGAVAALGRQLISYETRIQERVREQGNSGVTIVRSWGQGTSAYHDGSYAAYGVVNIHNHANTHHTIGMGEFGAVLNGVQFTTRHNDYSMVEPDNSKTVSEYISKWPPASKDIEYPEVPPDVLNAGNVNNQVAEMREWFRAWHTQNTTHRNYTDYFRPVLCYLEGTWINAQEDVAEPFSSERHHIDADGWNDLNEKTNFLFQNGQKNNLENLPYLPTSIRSMIEKSGDSDTFEPNLAQWFYRISCKPLADHLPTSRFRVKDEVHLQMRESKPATREKMAKTVRAVFDLNPTMPDKWKATSPWPKGKTKYEYLDELMYQISGFDGPNANLLDESFGATCATPDGNAALNTARYTRYYSMLQKDAMGRTDKKRAFNDYMFAAQTTHKRVNPLKVCTKLDPENLKVSPQADKDRDAECLSYKSRETCVGSWDESQVTGGATGAKCAWTSRRQCVYKKCWEQRWSYSIPLEIIYLTPLSKWNPYNIPYYSRSDKPMYDDVTTGGRNGKTDKPYKGTRQDLFYRTPATFFKDATQVDAADTSGGVTYVLDQSGTKREVRASGHWILFPEIDSIEGKIRQRWPVFPVHEHGNTIFKEVKAVEELIMGKDNQEIKDIIEETRSEAYGADLKLLGSGHNHQVHISPSEMLDLKEGRRTYVYKTSTLANAHTHYIKVNYDKSQPHGSEWSLDWCTQSGDRNGCPGSVGAGNCGKTSKAVDCCYGSCPDGHTGVEVIL